MRSTLRGCALALAGTVVCAIGGGSAYGQANSTFTIVPQQDKYIITPGQSAVVNFSLRETYTGGTAFFDSEVNRLPQFDTQVTRKLTNPANGSAAFITAGVPDPAVWDFDSGGDLAPDAMLVSGLRLREVDVGAPPTNPGGNVRNVSLGSVTIQGGMTPLVTTFFELDQRPPPQNDFLTTTDQVIDAYVNQGGPTPFRVIVRPNQMADANLDGAVNSSDLSLLLNSFGSTSGAVWQQGDFNFDEAVNSSDLSLLLNNFGAGAFAPTTLSAGDIALVQSTTGIIVPEPTCLSVLGIAATGLLVRRRRARR